MTGYMLGMGYCCGCGNRITFNPMKVPSLRVNGSREPVCIVCFNKVNENRRKAGLSPNVLHPDAYEPREEGDVS